MAIPDFIQEALDRAPLAVDDLYEDEIAEVERRAAEIRFIIDHADGMMHILGVYGPRRKL